MSPFQRHRWFIAAAGVTLAFAAVSFSAHKSIGLTGFSDLLGLALMLLGTGAALSNAITRPTQERSFWVLMALGFALWATNQSAWAFWELVIHRSIPDPYSFDIILFLHPVPMIAAVAWRPDILKREGRIQLSLLNFLMLLGWWTFLYAFIVFPHQYVVLNVRVYDIYYERLFGVENLLLLAVLGLAAWTGSGGWRRLYLHLLATCVLYGINSQLLDRATANNTYYSGSLYDIPLIGTVAWMTATVLSARDFGLESVETRLHPRWKRLVPQLAMLAILSLPVLGLWTALLDTSPAPSRAFRIFAVLSALLLLGTFVFLRQYFQDQTLVHEHTSLPQHLQVLRR